MPCPGYALNRKVAFRVREGHDVHATADALHHVLQAKTFCIKGKSVRAAPDSHPQHKRGFAKYYKFMSSLLASESREMTSKVVAADSHATGFQEQLFRISHDAGTVDLACGEIQKLGLNTDADADFVEREADGDDTQMETPQPPCLPPAARRGGGRRRRGERGRGRRHRCSKGADEPGMEFDEGEDGHQREVAVGEDSSSATRGGVAHEVQAQAERPKRAAVPLQAGVVEAERHGDGGAHCPQEGQIKTSGWLWVGTADEQDGGTPTSCCRRPTKSCKSPAS